MGREVLVDCLPWLGLLLVSLVSLRLLARLGGSRPRLGRVIELHRDEGGAAQSLSFVLTLPFFVMIILFIVQVSQLMIGTIVVHYAAFAAARSAIVWAPAGVGSEPENCFAAYAVDLEASDQVIPILDPDDPDYGPTGGGVTYVVVPGSPKFLKIASAAVMACMPISPSRDVGLQLSGYGPAAADILKSLYGSIDAESSANGKIPQRLDNKLAYAMANTWIEIRFFHSNHEPPLVPYFRPNDLDQFRYLQELGWQDPITVTVHHNLALLPGPGRLLAKPVPKPDGSPDTVGQSIDKVDNVYVYPLEASATLGIEGEKSVIPYGYYVY
jgi:hypothetical protein